MSIAISRSEDVIELRVTEEKIRLLYEALPEPRDFEIKTDKGTVICSITEKGDSITISALTESELLKVLLS